MQKKKKTRNTRIKNFCETIHEANNNWNMSNMECVMKKKTYWTYDSVNSTCVYAVKFN